MKTSFYKIICSLGAFLLLVGLSAQAQPNDVCGAALPLTPGVPATGSTSGATFDNVGTCFTSNTAPGVWYFVVGNGGLLTVETCGGITNYDTKLHLYSGNCGALVCEDGNDDACGLQSRVSTVTSPGQLYYVLVHGFSSNTGNFTLTATLGSPPSGNDVCGGATPIACGQTVSGSTAGSTPDNQAFCGTSNTSPGVWYQLVGTGGPVEVTTCNAGSNYDTKLSVYTGACGALTCVDGDDDDFTCSFSGLRSTVAFNSTPGQIYYILVHGFGSSTGNFELSVDCPSPPANDDVCNATPISFGATTYSTGFATAQSGEPNPGAGTGTSSCTSQDGWCSFELDVDNSVWFTFQAPASGCVSIVADGGDTQLAMYEASNCNDFTTFTEVAANDDSGDDIIPGANIFSAGIVEASCLTPGATYYVQVDGFNGATINNGTLTLIDCGGAPLAVDAGECQSRFVGYSATENDTNFIYATATGGEAPYTYSWSGADILYTDGNGAAVQPSATTTYTVTVTDNRGCEVTDQVTVIVENVDCSNNQNSSKVAICHIPPGNPNNPQDICISVNAVQTHLNNHGDLIGSCSNTCRTTEPRLDPPPACVDLTVSVSTDDFASETSWEIVERGSGTVVGSRQFTFNDDFQTFTNTFCVDPRECYDVRIDDSFGDGICCTFGQGTWSVTFDGTTTNSPSGGAYGSSETISVGQCTNKGSEPSAVAADLDRASELMIVAYPNPASNNASIKFASPEAGNVVISVYSLTGSKVAEAFNGAVEAGVSNTVNLNTSELPDGVYIYRLFGPTGAKAGKIQIAH
jgi:hypothetical protein